MTFFGGLASFITAAIAVMSMDNLRRWYSKLIWRCLGLALLALVGLLLGGSWIFAQLGQGWWSGIGVVLWVICVLFLAGRFTVAFVTAFVGALADEKELLSALHPGLKVVGLKPANWGDRRREWIAMVTGLFVTLVGWPLFLIPVLIPFGVLLFAWTMGREASAAARRLLRQNGETPREDLEWAGYVGLGILPAALSLVPIVGWACAPIILVAAVTANRTLRAPR